jgi:hypothetical protein
MVKNYNLQERLRKQTMMCIIFVLLPMLFAVGGLQGQTAIQASTTANVYAKIFTAVTLVKTSYMNFGHFYPLSYNGQLINKPDGILSVKGSIEKGGDINYSTSFDVSGDCNTAFAISLPKSPIMLTNKLVAKTITVSNWKSASLPASGDGKLPTGSKKVNLDATLKLGSTTDNPFGYYSGFYTVTFGFN